MGRGEVLRLALLSALSACLASGAGAQLIVDEDFTDGELGASEVGAWAITGAGEVDFLETNGRELGETRTVALSRDLALLGENWGVGAAFALAEPVTLASGQILLFRYAAFSDVARNSSEFYKVVINVNEFEVSSSFATNATGGQRQIYPKVNGQGNAGDAGVMSAHWVGPATPAILDGLYDAAVAFRPETRVTMVDDLPVEETAVNVESRGENPGVQGDYVLATVPVGALDSVTIQLLRPLGADNTFATNANETNAQVGIARLLVAIYSAADVEGDGAIDQKDIDKVAAAFGAAPALWVDGDADNDGMVGNGDLGAIFGAWTAGEPDESEASLVYFSATGKVAIEAEEKVTNFVLKNGAASFDAAETQFPSNLPTNTATAGEISYTDTAGAGFTGTWELGTILPDGLDAVALEGLLTRRSFVGRKGGGVRTLAIVVDDTAAGPVFRRGDANDDGQVDISDAVWTLSWLFQGGPEPPCKAAANTNGETAISITQPIYLLSSLFTGGPPPLDPYPGCGASTLDVDLSIGCASYSHCR